VQTAIAQELVLSCHDLSEGGLGVAAAELAFSGGIGIEIDLQAIEANGDLDDIALLFEESPSRLLLEVAPENSDKLAEIIANLPGGCIGKVTDTGRVIATGKSGKVLDVAIEDAKAAWQRTFDW